MLNWTRMSPFHSLPSSPPLSVLPSLSLSGDECTLYSVFRLLSLVTSALSTVFLLLFFLSLSLLSLSMPLPHSPL